jgi:hypothetical protein
MACPAFVASADAAVQCQQARQSFIIAAWSRFQVQETHGSKNGSSFSGWKSRKISAFLGHLRTN